MKPAFAPGLALMSAALFGISTPLAKVLGAGVNPWLLAGLLYLGSGTGLALWRAVAAQRDAKEAPLARADLPWMAAVVFFGGIAAPLLLMFDLGAARTGAYVSVAPFAGALVALPLLGEPLTLALAVAAVLMGVGVWLHLTEWHEHWHEHEPLTHAHAHVHDEHHQHTHGPGDPVGEPRVHMHTHEALRHKHPHYPDLHHRHGH